MKLSLGETFGSPTRSAALVIAVALAGAALALAPADVATYADGPPAGHTGGFGEPTCRACHFDNPLQPAGRSLSLSGLPAAYSPGVAYDLEIQLRDPEARRAGFQLAARFASESTAGHQAGVFSSAGDRTRVVTAAPSGVQYAQHTREGAAIEASGPARWSLRWTAPDHPRGPVAFHIAANASNGDDSAFGDVIYAAETIVHPASPSRDQRRRTAGVESATSAETRSTAETQETTNTEFRVTDSEFRGLSTAGAGVVWAGGRGGVFAHTSDGGATWDADTIPGAEDLFFVDAHAVDARTAYLLGTAFDGGLARMYKTSDAGMSWRVQFEDSTSGTFFDGMAFWDDRRGVAFGDPVGGSFVIVTTRDGGATWSRVPAEAIPEPLPGEAGFAASGTAITVHGSDHAWFGTGGGERARVYLTEDGGATWEAYDTPLAAGPTAGIFGLTFRDPDNGIAVGGDYTKPDEASANILETPDGGRTWRLIGASSPAGVRYGVTHLVAGDSTLVVATGPSGWGYSPDGGRTWIPSGPPGYNTVAAAAGGIVWAAGREGRIARTTLDVGR